MVHLLVKPFALAIFFSVLSPAAVRAAPMVDRVATAFDDFVGPCLSFIETGSPSGIPARFQQVRSKPVFRAPAPNGASGWSAEMEFDVRRRQPECKLRVQGAIRNQADVDRLGDRLARVIPSTGKARFLGVLNKRGRTYRLYQVGSARYRLSLLSGGRNSETAVHFIYEGPA